jgi:hypothetical protein
LFCTQETSITYSSLDVAALALALNANATGGTKAANHSSGVAVVNKVLNAMNYSSATLYWKRDKDFSRNKEVTDLAPPLVGSGVSFGLSVVVKNLWTAIGDIENGIKSEWLATTACLLNVTYEELWSFLDQKLVENLITDLQSCPQSRAQTEPWADRSVLIEASFALDNGKCTYIDVVEGVPKEFLQEMLKARGKLQCFRLRFRIADRREVTKSWGLGFKIAGIGIGVSVLGIDNAAAEGIVDLCTRWVKSKDNAGRLNFLTDPPENGVPPVTLFCQ